MTEDLERIPFQVEVGRIIEVLATQIYQSPLALLRENTQNSFDAILLRRNQLGHKFEPRIDVSITADAIGIQDNGVGMTRDDLRQHYWRAGSSSKNNAEARAAGVVGTFGIGAMANFGIADELTIETESAVTGARTLTSARKATLSTSEDCISMEDRTSQSAPGTLVTAHISEYAVNINEATSYIADFVAFLDIPVYVNGQLVSQQDLALVVPEPAEAPLSFKDVALTADTTADIELRFTSNGEIWVRANGLRRGEEPLAGELVLRQGMSTIRTYRTGFGLATVGVSSFYQLGGVANMTALEPTAGREALTTSSMQLLQTIVSAIDAFASLQLADRSEADANNQFMEWVRQHGRFDLCRRLRARVEPGGQRIQLSELETRSKERDLLTYAGSDATMIHSIASDDSPLVVIATHNPRRQCEQSFLSEFCQCEPVQDTPTVLAEKPGRDWTIGEQAIAFRIANVLATDYFLEAEVGLGKLSHGLPILAELEKQPARVVLDWEAPTFTVIETLYGTDYAAFGSMVKDFVRNVVFPRVADRVPSSTRQGAEAFLKTIRRTRDVFEYEWDDLDSLSSVWSSYLDGQLSMDEVVNRATNIVQRNVQVVDSAAAQAVRDVLPDVISNEEAMEGASELRLGAAPPILRTEISSDAKLLTIAPHEVSIQGFRCFIALSERAREERGDFFLQPHSTSVVWGGQKVLFVFQHHSGEFGLYYDLQTSQVVAPESGGGPFPTSTIVLRDRIYIPIPDVVMPAFVPAPDERKKFEVRCDLLYTEGR